MCHGRHVGLSVDRPFCGMSAALFDPAVNGEDPPICWEVFFPPGGWAPAWLYADSWAMSMLNVSLRVVQMCWAVDCTLGGREEVCMQFMKYTCRNWHRSRRHACSRYLDCSPCSCSTQPFMVTITRHNERVHAMTCEYALPASLYINMCIGDVATVVSQYLVLISTARCTMHNRTIWCHIWQGSLWLVIIGLVVWVSGVVASVITGVSGRFRWSSQSLNLAI